jgi:hypothetical protein
MVDAKTPASKELAVADEEANALALGDDFLGDADSMDDFAQGDFLVPYMRILQSLSKELQKGHQKYIKGAEVGAVINSATKRMWDGEKGMYVIPIAFAHRFQAWRPNNGGPADDYGDNDAVYKSLQPNDKGKRINGDGNEVTDTNQYFVFVVDPETGEYDMGVIGMSGSQAKKSRSWNSIIANRRVKHGGKSVTPPMFYYAYKVTTVPESNEQGNWYGWAISADEGMAVPSIPNARDILEAAKTTRERIKAGEIKTQAEEVEDDNDVDVDAEKAF